MTLEQARRQARIDMTGIDIRRKRYGLAFAGIFVTILAACGGGGPVMAPPEVTVSTPITRAVQPYVDFT
jgi:predicted small lipoprotein YifL